MLRCPPTALYISERILLYSVAFTRKGMLHKTWSRNGMQMMFSTHCNTLCRHSFCDIPSLYLVGYLISAYGIWIHISDFACETIRTVHMLENAWPVVYINFWRRIKAFGGSQTCDADRAPAPRRRAKRFEYRHRASPGKNAETFINSDPPILSNWNI